MSRGWDIGAAVLAGLIVVTGCTANNIAQGVANANNNNIKRVANFYAGYAMHNGTQGPKNVEELKRFLQDTVPADKFEMIGVDPKNIDATFVSERDHKPFNIRWDIVVPPTSAVPLVFEADGVGGKKQVCDSGGQVREVDDAEYQRLWGAKTSAAAPIGPPPGENAGSDTSKQSAAK
jgi:hypothetical protein